MKKAQNIAEFNRKITIRQQAGTKDESTGFTPTNQFSDVYANIWASVDDTSGGEKLEDNTQLVSKQKTKFKIRYRTGIDTTMIVMFAGDLYNIREIRREGLRNMDFLVLVTEYKDNVGS